MNLAGLLGVYSHENGVRRIGSGKHGTMCQVVACAEGEERKAESNQDDAVLEHIREDARA
jgi:hypothetical protein